MCCSHLSMRNQCLNCIKMQGLCRNVDPDQDLHRNDMVYGRSSVAGHICTAVGSDRNRSFHVAISHSTKHKVWLAE